MRSRNFFVKSFSSSSKTSIQLKVKIYKEIFVFLHGLVRSVLKVFAELFPKKRLAYGESLLCRLAALAEPKAESVLAEAQTNQNLNYNMKVIKPPTLSYPLLKN